MRILPYPGPSNAKREGFGLAPEPQDVRDMREGCALRVLSLFRNDLSSEVTDEDLSALSEIKGLINRSHRQDQWDWYRVWCHLGCPPQSKIKPIGTTLGNLRQALIKGKTDRAREILGHLRDRGIDDALECYLSGYTSHAVDVIYALGYRKDSSLQSVGMTNLDAFKDVQKASLTKCGRLGVQAAWPIRPGTISLSEIHEELHDWRSRKNPAIFEIDLEDLRDFIDSFLEMKKAESGSNIAA